VKVECEQCHSIGYLQKVGKGSYWRVRHYVGIDPNSRKPTFQYHQITKEYAESQLSKIPIDRWINDRVIDPKLKDSYFITENQSALSSTMSASRADVRYSCSSRSISSSAAFISLFILRSSVRLRISW